MSVMLQSFFLAPVAIFAFAHIMSTLSARTASVSRKTNETQIEVSINLDCGSGFASEQVIDVSTGIGFLDHVRLSFDRSNDGSANIVPCS